MGLSLVQTISPVTDADLKLFLRVDHNREDDLISSINKAATSWTERFTGRKWVTAEYEYTLDRFPEDNVIELPVSPLVSVASVEYLATDGTYQTFEDWDFDNTSQPGRVYCLPTASFPSTYNVPSAVTITFSAGYDQGSNLNSVPEDVKTAIKILAASLCENRQAEITGTTISKVQFSVEALLYPYKLRF